MCGVCGRPVDKETFTEDQWRGELQIVVECHGAREEAYITEQEMAARDKLGVHMGTAFKKTKELTQ
jgi:hypothetical protein